MPITNGVWHPRMFTRQFEVFNSYARKLLVCGPRYSGKTLAVLHRIVRHLWETPDARVGMYTKTRSLSVEGGAWQDLHDIILKEWIDANIGLKYTTEDYYGVPGAKVSGNTRTPFFRIRNMHGGESEMLLFSLEHDADAEAKIKEKRFSMIYFSELDKFYDRRVLTVSVPSLRMVHLPYNAHQWIADCNPSDEGEASWIYQMWYVLRNQTYQQHLDFCAENFQTAMDEMEFGDVKEGLELIEIKPEENPFLDPRQMSELKFNCIGDPGLYSRHVEGKWVYGDGDASRHFRAFFKPNIHIVGSCEGSDEKNWETIIPSPECVELITGWDLGDTYSAAVIMEKKMLDVILPGKNQVVKRAHFFVLDELVKLNEEIATEDFTTEFMQLLEGSGDPDDPLGLEQLMGRQFGLENAWSDSSSIDKFSSTAGTFQYRQVEAASGGRIILQRADKAKGMVRVRVQLLKQLLAQVRIRISAHCVFIQKMLKDLKKGRSKSDFVVSNDEKHVFDALTYALLMECKEELENVPRANVVKRQPLIVAVS